MGVFGDRATLGQMGERCRSPRGARHTFGGSQSGRIRLGSLTTEPLGVWGKRPPELGLLRPQACGPH